MQLHPSVLFSYTHGGKEVGSTTEYNRLCCFLANHRLKTVCENEKLRLQCRSKSVLAIYSATYGRPLRGKPECDAVNGTGPDIGT